jgi:hypothetical protein
VLLAAVAVWALDSKHVSVPDVEMERFFNGQPLWAAGMLWLLYLAIRTVRPPVLADDGPSRGRA